MLPEINDDDIATAEEVLLGKRGIFGDERITFIKDLTTLDVQAVPGSLKTTALLAKLFILEKHLPFKDGSGILVISHTNAAVNEIKDRIGRFCPKLFSYPNFVGTIQSFVDQFLAIPFAHNYLRTGLKYIDTELYQNLLLRKVRLRNWDEDFEDVRKFFWGRHYPACFDAAKKDKDKAKQLCKGRVDGEIKNLFFNFVDQKIWTFGGKKALLADPANNKYQIIKGIINEVIKKEIISYEYAYNLAEAYIQKAPIVKRLLQRRFKFVFVDEMQDMERHQYDLLESLFGSNNVVYQRIGDKNQAIYSGKISLEDIWVDREKLLFLKGSHRLSPKVAQIVNQFALDASFNIDGLGDCSLSPCMIVFSEDRISEVLPKFLELVKKRIPEDVIAHSKYPIKCVGWRKEAHGDDLGITSYYPDFDSKASATRTIYPSLKSQIASWRLSLPQKQPMSAARRTVLETIISVLKHEDILQGDGKYFSSSSLSKYLRESHKDFYESFKLRVFLWSRTLCQGDSGAVIDDVRRFVPGLMKIFDRKLDKSSAFVFGDSSEAVQRDVLGAKKSRASETNVYRCSKTGLRMQVGTVHSVKGETHLATLYLETVYQSKHESDRLPHCFCNKGNNFCSDYEKETARVAYVAMSRPTNFLCFAIHQERYEAIKRQVAGWEIIDLTSGDDL
jgi:superfamily I DNA/RNA helicase